MGKIILGKDVATNEEVVLEEERRLQGLYLVGKTGTGKTTLISNLILQDIAHGDGVCFLDPHGDAIKDILPRMPAGRIKDVILLDPLDKEYPFGLNLLNCPDPHDHLAVTRACDAVMHVFEKLWGQDSRNPSWGPQLEDVLRNSTLTFLENPGYTLAEIPRLLTDEGFRASLVANVTNQDVKLFWEREYDILKLTDQAQYRGSTMRRLRAFLVQPIVRNIVGQANTTIDFRKVMDEGKILLVNLPVLLGEDVTSLLGTMIVGQMLSAVFSRADTRIRRPFYLYADEYQRFGSHDFATLLAEARKYGIGTTIAHQFREQFKPVDLNRFATMNAATIAVMQVTADDAKDFAPLYAEEPPPGESEYKPIMQRQYRREHQTVWEPPEAEAQYHQVCLQLTALTGCLHVLQSCGIPSFSLSQSPEELEIESAKAIAEFSELQNSEAAFSLYAFYNPDFAQVDFANDCIPIPSTQQQLVLSGEQAQAFTFARSIPLPIDKELEKWMSAYGPSMHPETDKINAAVRAYVTHLQAQIHSILAPFHTNAVFLMIPYAPQGPVGEALFYEKLEQERARRSRQRGLRLLRTKNSEIIRSDKSYDWYNHQSSLYQVQKNDRAWDLRRKLSYMEYVDAKEAFWRVHAYPILLDWLKDQLSQLLAEIKPVLAEEKRLSACQKTKEVEIDLGYSYTVEDVFAHEELRGRYHVTVTDARKTRYEEKPGKPPRTVLDMVAEMAEQLLSLPPFVAKVRIGEKKYTIATSALPPASNTLTAVQQHIQAQTRASYCKPSKDVEEELAQRQASVPPSPPVSPQTPQGHTRRKTAAPS